MKVAKMIVMLAAVVLLVGAAGCVGQKVAPVEKNDVNFGPYKTVVILKHRLGVDSVDKDTIALLEDLQTQLAATKLFDKVAYTCDFNHDKETILIMAQALKGETATMRYTLTNVVTEEVLATKDIVCDDRAKANRELVDFIVSHTKR